MTPGARLQATIELLDIIDRERRPADRILSSYWRGRRYAGAHDRRWVAEAVYAVLRNRAKLGWRLSRAGFAPDADRFMRGLAMLAAQDAGFDLANLQPNDPHGAIPPTADERAALTRAMTIDAETAPDWVAGEAPEWLAAPLRARFGVDFAAEMAALNQRAPLDLRVNGLKASREAVLAALAAAGIAAEPTALSPIGVRLGQAVDLRELDLYRQGWVEPQDSASQLAALLVDARPGVTVIDFCAGGGGKTLALAAAMGNQGQLLAFDTDARRLEELTKRARRAGARNIQIGGPPDAAKLQKLAAQAARVLVDAPCSGTGVWRRAPEARWRLDAQQLARHVERQDELLERASDLVAPGGRMIYATCSLLGCENEERLEHFLRRHRDFAVLPQSALWAETVGGAQPCPDPYLLLTPRRHQTDGFFVGVLRRNIG